MNMVGCSFISMLFIAVIFSTSLMIAITAHPLFDHLESFSLRRKLADDEEELYAAAKGVWASKLSLVHPTMNSVALVTSSDQKHLIKSIYGGDGRLIDCDVVENIEIIEKFIDQVRSNVNDPTKSVANNTTLKLIEGEMLLDADEAAILNSAGQKRECRSYQRRAKQADESQQQTTNGSEQESVLEQSSRAKRSYLIFPGTNWCGRGNAAEHANELGANGEADKCCRQHDLCPFAIEGFSSRYNLFNYRLHTLSHCDCDKVFMDCLKDANSGTANLIGKVYFNVVNTQCFGLKLEKTCAKRTWWGTCDRHETQWVAEVKTLGSYNSEL